MRRKPTKKEIFLGCVEFLKIMLIGFFTFNISKMQMGWGFFKLTAQGKFEVTEENSKKKRIREEWRKEV